MYQIKIKIHFQNWFTCGQTLSTKVTILAVIVLVMSISQLAVAEQVDTISQNEVNAISLTGPSAESPFFVEREEARQALAQAATNSTSMNPPLPPRPSVKKQVGQFFHSFVKSIKVGNKKKLPPMELLLEPSVFSVADVSELNVTFKITNNKKEIILMEFPTNQRFEILIKEPSGRVIYRWSEDRSFDAMLGLVTIDPEESVVYTEKIPITMMKDGTTYSIEVTLLGQQGYCITQKITPHAREHLDSAESDREYLHAISEKKETFL
ncbi:MAG: hypothetical protein A3F67_06535 [Verrucomicrobia bacterium RIFCSPHIGHO2_12_FULL_41_10]|nr:MAG: hypothetical protein A3F67_06535 [Verrucomicrobia bacterium RIFCSPHIGHO2_12_FULL_41_10]